MRSMNLLHVLPIGLLLLVNCGGDDASPVAPSTIDPSPPGPQGDSFEWSGSISPGNSIEIKGINGGVDATGTSGGPVQVSATKTAERSDTSSVRIEVVEHAAGVTICAVYPDVPDQPANVCLPGDQGNLGAQDNDVAVNFDVTVPAGVTLVAKTINGGVIAEDLFSDASVTLINGEVDVSTTGLAEATLVNGPITASIGQTDWGRDLAFTAVNGDISVEVPAGTNAVVEARTVNGTIVSDFPLTEVLPGQMTGTLGSGGPMLTLSTVNGNVALARGS